MTAGGQRKTILEARRRSILRMHRNGSSNLEIAHALGLSCNMVSFYVSAERKRKAVHGRLEEKVGLEQHGGQSEHHGVAAGHHEQRRS